MPVGKVFNAAENQILISPVSNYYAGKAVRLANKNKEIANEIRQQEADANLPERQMAVAEGSLEQRIKEYGSQVGKDKALEEANTIIGITEGAKSSEDPLAYANERMKQFIETLPKGEGRSKLEKMNEDGFQANELKELYSFSLAVNKQFSSGTANAKTAQKFIDKNGKPVQGSMDKQGNYFDSSGKQRTDITPIAPQAGQDDLSGLTSSGLSKVTIDFRNKVAMAATGAQSATELVEISKQSPEALGKSGAIVSFGNEVQKTAKNLLALTAPAPLPASETKKQDAGWSAFEWDSADKAISKLGLTPIEAARFKSGIYSIAFSAAVGEQGARPSDKDIQQYIAIYGGNLTDAKAFRSTIAQAMRRQHNMLKNTADLNPEIEDSAASLAVFEKPYNEFLLALKGTDNTGNAPAEAIQYLKDHPETAKLFKQKYGYLPEGA